MKKLYRKGQVHPSPSPSPSTPPSSSSSSSSSSSDQFLLSYLPAAILTLAAALSTQDKQVLAYLLSCSSSSTPFDFDPSKKQTVNLQQHPPSSTCYCFSCYTNFWARWDASPNRQLIHEIIDAFEDNLMSQRKKKKQGLSRKEKRKNNSINNNNNKIGGDFNNSNNNQSCGKINVDDCDDGSVRVGSELGRVDSVEEEDEEKQMGDETGEVKQGSVRKIVSMIWGSVWG